MISTSVTNHLKNSFRSVHSWKLTFSEDEQKQLMDPGLLREIGQLSYIDGYFRIRQTTPLILAAAKNLDERFDHDSSRFWIRHLEEEYGHDAVMRSDIITMIGDESRAIKLIEATSITPPSVALVGFFDWQVRHNNPHLLILLRLFLETFVVSLDEKQVAGINELFPTGSGTLRVHRDADQDHVADCYAYIDQKFILNDIPTLIWILDYIALCLRESQSWIAAHALGRRSR